MDNVRFGLGTDILITNTDVRFTPKSGHRQTLKLSALCQKRTSSELLNDFVGDREQLSWDIDAKRSRRLQIDDKFKFVRL